MGALPPFSDDVWEPTTRIRTGARRNDLAAEMPEKLAELQQLWLDEVCKANVLPLDDRRIERQRRARRPPAELVKGNSQLLFSGMGTAQREQPHQHQEQVVRGHGGSRRARGAEGVILARSGAFAG